jgi:hypothetical protein
MISNGLPEVPEPLVEDGQHDAGLEAEGDVGVGDHLFLTNKS